MNRLREIFNDETISSVRSKLYEEGFTVRQEEDTTYAINFGQHIIINLTEENFNLERLKKQSVKQIERQKYQQQTKSTSHFSGKTKLRDVGGGSHSEKREWEVGQKGDNRKDLTTQPITFGHVFVQLLLHHNLFHLQRLPHQELYLLTTMSTSLSRLDASILQA